MEDEMAEGSVSNRWWENYLVRYFLPAIAGMLIVLWLRNNSGASIYIPELLPRDTKDFNTAHLLLWLLLGSLYCYLASYPALVFHATRVLDFSDGLGNIAKWKYMIWNPYIWSLLFAVAAAISAYRNSFCWSILCVLIFAVVQIVRIILAILIQGPFGLVKKVRGRYDASISYAYLRTLSERRSNTIKEKRDRNYANIIIMKDEKDIVDSYRHLREHGNTALIVLYELSMCPIIYIILEKQENIFNKIVFASVIGAWVFPSVLTHYMAQHLERRFSWFDYSPDKRE